MKADKKQIIYSIALIAGVAIATTITIMYFKKCYVTVKGKKYGFNPNQ